MSLEACTTAEPQTVTVSELLDNPNSSEFVNQRLRLENVLAKRTYFNEFLDGGEALAYGTTRQECNGTTGINLPQWIIWR